MVVQTTHLWMVLTLEEGDILNCRILTLNKDTALDTLAGVAENDNKNTLWYKLIHFEADGVFYSEDTTYIVIKIEDDGRIEVLGIYDQYEMIPEQIRHNELAYWIEDLEVI